MTQPRGAAEQWLDRVYGGAAEPTRYALLETDRVAVFGCRLRDESLPMLAAALAVPKNGDAPYPLANDRPFADLGIGEDGPDDWRAPTERDWVWRVNARNCVVVVDAVVDRSPASTLPWQPWDERPGWWDRLRGNHFRRSEVSACQDWSEVLAAVRDGGPDTRGVVWVRRELAGVEVTGHLLYAHNDGGEVAVLDGLHGGPADLETATVKELVLARFHRPRPAPEPDVRTVDDAVRKARRHLADVYGGQVVLVDPDPADELDRGWLFACTTRAFLDSGDPRDQMLDAALVVPKDGRRAPFGLPNSDPWPWLERWDAGDDDLTATPAPGPAAWFGPTTARLGEVTGVSAHARWVDVLAEFGTRPPGSAGLVWVRRRDRRGRESVGLLINARRVEGGLELVDGLRPEPVELTDEGVLGLHVVHYRQPSASQVDGLPNR
ncbi:YrhB domain-containing protein [Actinosynnema sp. NPDC047251]|uniref:YrhB domain-containing protein n=1 Tax=Saccharothrix espanaensis TaxID=103731 RepID=UPI0002EBD678|nr:YrhB domain-containing protein [Saccharothrix espanaensis]